jgi:hypothetical protein
MNLKLKTPHFHLEIIKLGNLIGIILIVFSILAIGYTAFYSYKNLYKPLITTEVPEDKLQQKQEKIKTSELNDVKTKIDEKKAETSKIQVINPFQEPQS